VEIGRVETAADVSEVCAPRAAPPVRCGQILNRQHQEKSAEDNPRSGGSTTAAPAFKAKK